MLRVAFGLCQLSSRKGQKGDLWMWWRKGRWSQVGVRAGDGEEEESFNGGRWFVVARAEDGKNKIFYISVFSVPAAVWDWKYAQKSGEKLQEFFLRIEEALA